MGKRISMTEKVLQELRNEIVNWNYDENDMITEAEISKKYGVSKTPSRDALNCLCMEGLLEKIPNKGYLVKGISVTELQSLFQFREILEKASAEMAIHYATDEELKHLKEHTKEQISRIEGGTYQEYSETNMQFHMSVAYLSRNQYLISSLENILNKLRRVLVKDWRVSEAKILMAEHLELTDALCMRDVERAKQSIEKELGGVGYRLYFQEGKTF